MPSGTPQALVMRASLALSALALLVMATVVSAPPASAQTPEGRIRLLPALSAIPAEGGSFTVFIVLEDLEHLGRVPYDDNRDTLPDRYEDSIGLAAFEFTLEYDQAVLAVGGVERGPELGRTGRTFQCLGPAEEPGSFRFGCVSQGAETPGPQGTLTLAAVELLPVGPGLSPLALEAGLSGPLGDDAPAEVSGGAVRVAGRPIAIATSQPGSPTASTPSPAGTAPPPGTAEPTSPATSEPVRATKTPSAGDGERPGELTLPRDSEAGPGRPAETDGGFSGSAALWLVVGVASLTAASALGLAAVFWQRRKQGGA